MAKINLNNITNPQSVSVMNANFQKIMVALDEQVLYRDNPDEEPNQMENDQDMNGKRIYNLPVPVGESEPLRKADAALIVTEFSQLVIDAANAATIAAGIATEAANNANAAAVEATEEAQEAIDISNSALGVVNDALTTADNAQATANSATTNINLFKSDIAGSGGSALVGYLRTAAGASVRTLKQKLDDIISVKDYGAVGNGVADDTVAINSAIADLVLKGGGTLFFPRGVYLSGKITVFSNIWLVGEGRSNTTIKLKNSVNTDLIYGDNADNLWGSNSGGGVQNVGIYQLTLDGNRANNLTAGSGIAIYGEEFYWSDLSITNTREHGIRSEWARGDSIFGMESNYNNIRIDGAGKHGWLNNGPHDSVTTNLIVIDAGLNDTNTWDGLFVGVNMTGRWIGCHVWNRQASNRHRWALNLAAGGGGNEFVASHFEGAYSGNVGIFCNKNLFDSTCRYYSAWNGVNIYFGGTATHNNIKGQLDSPGLGRPDSVGFYLGGAGGDYIAYNNIDVDCLDQNGGNVVFTNSDGFNNIKIIATQASGNTAIGVPHVNDIVDIRSNGGTPAVFSSITQYANRTIAPGTAATWTFANPFPGAPFVMFSEQSPTGTIASGLWISSLSSTAVSIFNSSAVTVTVMIQASRP